MKFIMFTVITLNFLIVSSFRLNRNINALKRNTRMVIKMTADFALLFDCDGVIVETEELHRLAYNEAFRRFGLKLSNGKPVEWSVAYYDILQNTVGGGKPKMKHYFNNDAKEWPSCTTSGMEHFMSETTEEKDKLIDMLQDEKTSYYIKIVENEAKTRPGVLELMDAAIADPRLKVGICSAATKAGFEKIVNTLVGKERLALLDVVMAGDDVSLKKPDPMIYNTAREIIGIPADRCVVIEDSLVGLRAAKSAGMRCIITYTDSTRNEDFYGEGADAKVPDLGAVSLDAIFGPLRAAGLLGSGTAAILQGIKD